MKTLDQILLDNSPFYPDPFTDTQKMRFMFMLENGSLIGDSEGRNHSVLLGCHDDNDPQQIEKSFCEQNKALRLCFESYREKPNGARGEFWCVYVQIFDALPNDAQWRTLGTLYNLKDRQNTNFKWDVHAPETKRGWVNGEGTLSDFRRQLYPEIVAPKKRAGRKQKRTQLVKARRAPRGK
jgi:hypothetical protein